MNKFNQNQIAVYNKVSKFIFITLFLIVCMIVLGSLTRLTNSGLSITDMELIKGIIPPLNNSDWNEYVRKFNNSLEGSIKYNSSITLQKYKEIFYLEYFHRLTGRFLGLFVIAFTTYFCYFYFLKNRILSWIFSLRLLFLILLVSLQGFAGWVMVASGLNNRTAYIVSDIVRVSQIKLAIHLTLAFIFFIYTLGIYFSIKYLNFSYINFNKLNSKLKSLNYILMLNCLFIFLTILFGAFVAGTHAGLAYKTFPLMNGSIFPKDIHNYTPWYYSFYEHLPTIQFYHRILAFIVVLFSIYLIYRLLLFDNSTYILSFKKYYIAILLAGFIGIQLFLAYLLIISYQPGSSYTTLLGVLHQICGLCIFSTNVWCCWLTRIKTYKIYCK